MKKSNNISLDYQRMIKDKLGKKLMNDRIHQELKEN